MLYIYEFGQLSPEAKRIKETITAKTDKEVTGHFTYIKKKPIKHLFTIFLLFLFSMFTIFVSLFYLFDLELMSMTFLVLSVIAFVLPLYLNDYAKVTVYLSAENKSQINGYLVMKSDDGVKIYNDENNTFIDLKNNNIILIESQIDDV